MDSTLIENLSNVNISYGVKIKQVHFDTNNTAEYVSTFEGVKYYGSKIILSAGAIQTPAILQRSGIDCGKSCPNEYIIVQIWKRRCRTCAIYCTSYPKMYFPSVFKGGTSSC